MSASTIGLQTIMPETATSPQPTPPPQPAAENGAPRDYEAMVAEAVARQAPPPPGMGQLLDKTV